MEMNDEAMKMLTSMIVEGFTNELAEKARLFAKTLPKDITGSMALEAFASAIEGTNQKMNPTQSRA